MKTLKITFSDAQIHLEPAQKQKIKRRNVGHYYRKEEVKNLEYESQTQKSIIG